MLVVLGFSLGSVFLWAQNGKKGAGAMDTLVVESTAFASFKPIPAEHTCDGADVSPPLSWRGVPSAAKSQVILCDDPDAPGRIWVHWILYNLLPGRDSLLSNIPKTDTIVGGGTQGKNDFKRIGWNGPCPPGGTHRYFFKVYALDYMLNLPAGKTKQEVEKAMKGHILAQGELVGTYARKR